MKVGFVSENSQNPNDVIITSPGNFGFPNCIIAVKINPSMVNRLIVLLTDFGALDPFVGIMKGVIAGIAPETRTIDLTHELPPGDIRRAAITLWQAVPFFPSSTVFLAVVDPGVGTPRRPLFIQSGAGIPGEEYIFIGPDNGLFSFVLSDPFQAWELAEPAFRLPQSSATFHGRDIFAPAAAHATRSVPGSAFGPPVLDPLRLPTPRLESVAPGSLSGEILFADRFGNYLTSLGIFKRPQEGRLHFQPWLPGVSPQSFAAQETRLILPGGARLPLVDTFGLIPPGEIAMLIGSSGLLEIAANRGSAAELLHLAEGAEVIFTTSR